MINDKNEPRTHACVFVCVCVCGGGGGGVYGPMLPCL